MTFALLHNIVLYFTSGHFTYSGPKLIPGNIEVEKVFFFSSGPFHPQSENSVLLSGSSFYYGPYS